MREILGTPLGTQQAATLICIVYHHDEAYKHEGQHALSISCHGGMR